MKGGCGYWILAAGILMSVYLAVGLLSGERTENPLLGALFCYAFIWVGFKWIREGASSQNAQPEAVKATPAKRHFYLINPDWNFGGLLLLFLSVVAGIASMPLAGRLYPIADDRYLDGLRAWLLLLLGALVGVVFFRVGRAALRKVGLPIYRR